MRAGGHGEGKGQVARGFQGLIFRVFEEDEIDSGKPTSLFLGRGEGLMTGDDRSNILQIVSGGSSGYDGTEVADFRNSGYCSWREPAGLGVGIGETPGGA